MSDYDIETIEISMEHAQKMLDLKKSLDKLMKNRDFKNIVLEGYFEKEAQRLVMLKSDYTMQSPDNQAEIIKQIDSIGSFRQYLNMVRALGQQAEKSMDDLENTRTELLNEELDV